MFSQEEIDALRGDAATTHADLCQVLRQTLIDDRGVMSPEDPDDPWPVVASDVPVRITGYSTRGQVGQQGGADISEADYTAHFAAGYDIRNTDRIKVTTLGNRVFRMIAPRVGTYEIERVMYCTEEV